MLEQGMSSARDLEQWAHRLWRGWRVQRGGRDREGGVRVRSGDENGGEWETKHILPHLYNGYFSPTSSVLPVVPSRSRLSDGMVKALIRSTVSKVDQKE